MDCADFLDRYTDYRDGVLDDEATADAAEHVSACASCARYDRVVSRGVEVFRALPAVEPSSDFLPRLHHRIYQDDYEAARRRRRASGTSVAMMAGVAIAIAAAAWAPSLGDRRAIVMELPPVAAHAPHRVEPIQVLYRSGPLLTPPSTQTLARPANLLHEYSRLGSFASNPLRAP